MNNKRDYGLILATSMLAIGILIVFFPFSILDGLAIKSFRIRIQDYGNLGDFINGVTTPFLSISAFILLYKTYKSQTEELQQTREVLKHQSGILDKQQFETTFFNLLNLHHQIVNNIDLKSGNRILPSGKGIISEPGGIKSGRDCFVSFYNGLINTYNSVKRKNPQMDEKSLINDSYSQYYRRHQSDLGHYFRNLYHIFKFIHQSNIENKSMYASLVRAQLSSHELLMLFYNGLAPFASSFKPLIESYHLLKNMPVDDLIDESHSNFYEKSAINKINNL